MWVGCGNRVIGLGGRAANRGEPPILRRITPTNNETNKHKHPRTHWEIGTLIQKSTPSNIYTDRLSEPNDIHPTPIIRWMIPLCNAAMLHYHHHHQLRQYHYNHHHCHHHDIKQIDHNLIIFGSSHGAPTIAKPYLSDVTQSSPSSSLSSSDVGSFVKIKIIIPIIFIHSIPFFLFSIHHPFFPHLQLHNYIHAQNAHSRANLLNYGNN